MAAARPGPSVITPVATQNSARPAISQRLEQIEPREPAVGGARPGCSSRMLFQAFRADAGRLHPGRGVAHHLALGELTKRGRARGAAPAEISDRSASPAMAVTRPRGTRHSGRSAKAEPAAQRHDQRAKRMHGRMRKVPRTFTAMPGAGNAPPSRPPRPRSRPAASRRERRPASPTAWRRAPAARRCRHRRWARARAQAAGSSSRAGARVRSASASALLRANAVGALGSAPIIEMWITRRTPTFSHAANIAVVAST